MAITYTQSQTLTPDQYQNSFVNFYQQVLGIKGTYGDGGGGGGSDSDKQEETTTGVSYNMSPSDDDDTSPFVPGSSFVKSDGTMDINVMALDPENINSKISESEAFGSEPVFRNDRLNLFNLPDDSSLRKKVADNLEPAVKGVFAGASSIGQTSLVGAGLTGSIMGSFIGGETYKDEMGNTQFDPTGNPVLSAMGQLTRDSRRDILTRISAEAQANPAGDLGFAASIGNLMVVRGPGDGSYSGNRQSLSFQQIKNIEALSKGILPDTFRFEKDKDGQSGLFMGNKRINTGIEESGGVYLDPNNKQAGFYRSDGAIYTHRFGYAPVGMMSDVETLAKNYFPGMDAKTARDLALSAIQNARAGSGTLQSNLRDAASSTIYNMDMDFLGDEDKYSGIRTREEDLELQREQEAQQKAERAAASNRAIQAAKRRTELKQNVVDRREQRDIREVQKLQKEDPTFEDAFNRGGFIGMNNGGPVPDQEGQSGFVDGVPPSQATDAQEVADDRPTQLPEGAFVLNASSVEFAGEQDISKMLLDAHEEAIRRGAVSQGTSGDATRKMIDVAISRGEVVVAPYMVKIIGLDRLEKINKRGIRDTERKIEDNGQELEGVARGGFLDMNNGGEVASPFDEHIEIPEETLEALKKFGQRKRQRGEIDKFMATLSDRDAIMLTLLTETVSNITPVEDMEAIAEVIINRRDSDYQDFKNVKTVKEVLKQHVDNNPNKAYQFSGLEPSVLEARLNEVIAGTADKGLKKAFIAASNVTSPETEGYKRLPYNTLFYTKPGADSQWMRDSDLLEFADQIGPHEFYSAIPMDSKGRLSPEFP